MANRKNQLNKSTAQALMDQLYASGIRPTGAPPAPKKKSRKPQNVGGVEEKKYLSLEESQLLIAHVRNAAKNARPKSHRARFNEMAVMLLMMTALRVGELCDLQIRDLPVSHGKPKIRVRCGKYKISRSIDIPPIIIDLLPGYIKHNRRGARDGSYLFVSERNTKYETGGMRSKLNIICKKVGLKKLHPHMLRHTYLTFLYNETKDINFVQQQAGHKNIATTLIYVRTSAEEAQRQVKGLNIVKYAQNLY